MSYFLTIAEIEWNYTGYIFWMFQRGMAYLGLASYERIDRSNGGRASFSFVIPFTQALSENFKNKKRKKDLVSLAEYPDLVWCLYNDLWGTSVLFDDANYLHFSTQVINIWRIRESWYIAGKDHSSEILVVWMEIEETYNAGIVGINDCPLNNYVLVIVVVSF